VGAMQGAVLAANPEARVVDITHEVAPYDVEAGAFTLRAAFETYPAGTVHVAVVDPGVGRAQPSKGACVKKAIAGKSSVPMGSTWVTRFSEMRPCDRARSSPNLLDIHAWPASCSDSEKTSATM